MKNYLGGEFEKNKEAEERKYAEMEHRVNGGIECWKNGEAEG